MSEMQKEKILAAIRVLYDALADSSMPFSIQATGRIGEGPREVRGYLKLVRKPKDEKTEKPEDRN